MDNYYDWDEILKDLADNELYKILYDNNSNNERRIVAEKLLLQKGLIIKDENGKYIRELIDPKYLNFTAINLKKKTKEDTISELINSGLNEASSYRIVEYYLEWKKKQTKKSKICIIILLFGILFFLYAKIIFVSPLVLFFIAITSIFLGRYSPSIINFRKIKIFKVIQKSNP